MPACMCLISPSARLSSDLACATWLCRQADSDLATSTCKSHRPLDESLKKASQIIVVVDDDDDDDDADVDADLLDEPSCWQCWVPC